MEYLIDNEIKAYLPGQHKGDCTFNYVVLKDLVLGANTICKRELLYKYLSVILDKVIYLMDYFAPARLGAQITPPLPVNSTLLASTLKNMAIGNLTPDESSNEEDNKSEINSNNSEINNNKSEIRSSEESNNGPEAAKVDGNLLSSLATELKEIIQSFNKAIESTFGDPKLGYGKIFCQISCGKLKSPVFFPKGVSIEFDTSSVVLFDKKMYPIGATVSLKNCQTPLLPYKGLVSSIGLTDEQFKKYYAY